MRDDDAITEIVELQEMYGIDPADEFRSDYKRTPWPAFVVRRKFKTEDGTLLVASSVDTSKIRLLYLKFEKNPRGISAGDAIYYKKGCVQFLSIRSLRPIQHAVDKLAGATDLVHRLID